MASKTAAAPTGAAAITSAKSSQPHRAERNYVETVQTGNLRFLSGMLPIIHH